MDVTEEHLDRFCDTFENVLRRPDGDEFIRRKVEDRSLKLAVDQLCDTFENIVPSGEEFWRRVDRLVLDKLPVDVFGAMLPPDAGAEFWRRVEFVMLMELEVDVPEFLSEELECERNGITLVRGILVFSLG